MPEQQPTLLEKTPFGTASMTLMVALGGGVGTCGRWGVETLADSLFSSSSWMAIFIVNLLGAFSIGVFFSWVDPRFARLVDIPLQLADLPANRHWLSPLFIIGGLGSFTTYSSFSFEAVKLIEAGRIGTAIGFIALSLVTGILAVAVGMRVGIRLFHERVQLDP